MMKKKILSIMTWYSASFAFSAFANTCPSIEELTITEQTNNSFVASAPEGYTVSNQPANSLNNLGSQSGAPFFVSISMEGEMFLDLQEIDNLTSDILCMYAIPMQGGWLNFDVTANDTEGNSYNYEGSWQPAYTDNPKSIFCTPTNHSNTACPFFAK